MNEFYKHIVGKEIDFAYLLNRKDIAQFLEYQATNEGCKEFFESLRQNNAVEIFNLLFGFLHECGEWNSLSLNGIEYSEINFNIRINLFEIEYDCDKGFICKGLGCLTFVDMQNIIALLKPRFTEKFVNLIRFKVA